MSNILNCNIKQIKKLQNIPSASISLNSKFKDEDKNELGDFIANEKDLEEEFENLNLSENIKKLLYNSKLSSREISILTYRFGLDGLGERTLETIGSKFNLTRERIRQLEKAAIKKLRKSVHTKEFVEYMDNPDLALNNLKDAQKDWYIFQNKRNKRRNRYRSESEVSNDVLNEENKLDNFREDDKMKEKREKNKRERKSLSNLYEYFKEYSKEEVDLMIDSIPLLLTDERKNILYKKFGTDLRNPQMGTLTVEENTIFFNSVVMKMKTVLNQIHKGTFVKPTGFIEKPIEKPNVKPIERQIYIIGEVVESNLHSKILEIFNMPEFIELTHLMSIKESIIISLRLGYVNGKCFSTESIAKFLGMPQEDVIEISKNGINLMKNKLLDLIDDEMEKTDSNYHILAKVSLNEKKQ